MDIINDNYIRQARAILHETQVEFGERFGVNGSTVSAWESSLRSIPYMVMAFIIKTLKADSRKCPTCKGTGRLINLGDPR